jgi:hypothetical protein
MWDKRERHNKQEGREMRDTRGERYGQQMGERSGKQVSLDKSEEILGRKERQEMWGKRDERWERRKPRDEGREMRNEWPEMRDKRDEGCVLLWKRENRDERQGTRDRLREIKYWDEGKETRVTRGRRVVIWKLCMQEEIQGISDVQEEDMDISMQLTPAVALFWLEKGI